MRKGINFTLLCLQAILYILTVQAIPRGSQGDREELNDAQIEVPSAEQQLEEDTVSGDDDDSREADILESEDDDVELDEQQPDLKRSQRLGWSKPPLRHLQGVSEKIFESLNDVSITDSDTKRYDDEPEDSEENLEEENKINLYNKIRSAIKSSKLAIKDRDKRLSEYDNKQTCSSFEPPDSYEDTSPDESDAEDYAEKEFDSSSCRLTPGKNVNTKNNLENRHNVKVKFGKKLQFSAKKHNGESLQSEKITELNKAFNVLVCAVEKFMDLANKTMISKNNTDVDTLTDTTREHLLASPSDKDAISTTKELTNNSKETTSNTIDYSSEDSTTTDSTLTDSISTDFPPTDFSSADSASASKQTTSSLTDSSATSKHSTSTNKNITPMSGDTEETKATSNAKISNDHSETTQIDFTFKDDICSTKKKLEKGESTIPCEPGTETPEYRRRKLSKDRGIAKSKQKTQKHSKNNYLSTDDVADDGEGYVYHEYDSVDPNDDVPLATRKVSTAPTVHVKSKKSRTSVESKNIDKGEEEKKRSIFSKKLSDSKTKDLMKYLITTKISSFRNQHSSDEKQNKWDRKRLGIIHPTIRQSNWRKKNSNHVSDIQHLKVFNEDQIVKIKSHNPYSETETVELEYV